MLSKRKFERIVLAPIDSLTANVVIGTITTHCQVVNISYRGVAVLFELRDKPQVGQALRLTLDFSGKTAETNGEVKRIDQDLIGINFMAVSNEARALISHFLDPRYLGNQLREVPNKQLQDKQSQVFFGPNNTRLVISKRQGRGAFEKLQLIFANAYLSIDRQGAVTAGRYSDGSELMPDLEAIDATTFSTVDRQVIDEAIQLLKYVPLTTELRHNIAEKLALFNS